MSSAEWVADVGLPTLVTLVAVWVAYVFLRRQLEHDREMARAENRAIAGRRLGTELVAIASKLESASPGESYWTRPQWDEFGLLSSHVDQAELVIDDEDLFKEIYAVGGALSATWSLCQKSTSRQRKQRSRRLQVVIDNTVLHMMHPHNVRLQDIGKALLRWDGFPPLDLHIEPWDKVPNMYRRAEYESWNEAVSKQFEETLSRSLSRLPRRESDKV